METKQNKTAAADKDVKKTTDATTTAAAASAGTPDKKDTQEKASPVSETSKEGPLYKFFLDALKDIYFAEKQIQEALVKMKDAATTEELKEAFEDHSLMTQKHISRLEKVFNTIGEKADTQKCEAILGILKEGDTIIKETPEGSMTRDAALIIAAQKVEHYEIATYGGLVALAETMNLHKAADLLHKTLEDEEDTDHHLTDIAESYINFGASDEDEDEGDDNDDNNDDEDDDNDNYYYEEDEEEYDY